MAEIKSVKPLRVSSLRCFLCEETAIISMVVWDDICDVNLCLCCLCSRKPADDILKSLYAKQV